MLESLVTFDCVVWPVGRANRLTDAGLITYNCTESVTYSGPQYYSSTV